MGGMWDQAVSEVLKYGLAGVVILVLAFVVGRLFSAYQSKVESVIEIQDRRVKETTELAREVVIAMEDSSAAMNNLQKVVESSIRGRQ
jgi:archaellum component FlaF (FlaF/FlaG flagellin family)